MHVFVTGGTGHAGSYIIPELIAAGHEVTGLARSDTSAAALSALGAKVRRGEPRGSRRAQGGGRGLRRRHPRRAQARPASVRRDRRRGRRGAPDHARVRRGTRGNRKAAGRGGQHRLGLGNLGRPATEEDPALPSGDEYKGTLRVRNVVERAVIGLAERGVRSSIVRLPLIAHSTTDSAGFLPGLIALAKEKGVVGYPGDGANLWSAVHIRDVASVFRLALEKGPAGRYWHAIAGRGHPVPRDRRGHRQPSGPARREHSRGRPDAAGILRALHESGHRILPGDQPHHAPDPRLGTRCSPACSPIWTTAITSRPADGQGTDQFTHYEESP